MRSAEVGCLVFMVVAFATADLRTATAQDGPDQATFGGSPPKWRRKPTSDEMLALSPPAFKKGVNGKSTLDCAVSDDGHVSDCKIAGEFPAGLGFGEAALKLSRFFEIDPATVQESRRVMVPVSWVGNWYKPVPTTPEDQKRSLDRLRLAFSLDASPPLVEPQFKPVERRFAALAPIGPYFPEAALRQRVEGATVIACRIASDHHFSGCERLASVPNWALFDDAALRMAHDGFIQAPDTIATGQMVRVLVRFPKPPPP